MATGINTAMKTSVEVTMADVMPDMASTVAMKEDLYPTSKRAWTASTTIMASSTTVPIARTSAKRVSRLIENPANARKPKVPISATRIDTVGMSVERMSCRKTYTTRITRRIASNRVLTTSFIEA